MCEHMAVPYGRGEGVWSERESCTGTGACSLLPLLAATCMGAGVVYNDANGDGKRQIVAGGKGGEGGVPNAIISVYVPTGMVYPLRPGEQNHWGGRMTWGTLSFSAPPLLAPCTVHTRHLT